ncbi:hypothetical protein HYW17_02855 [Candidatus Uhrbacteria bacterium]|nr:hypothetical protein [Candidatus Uhrbacteria bacterium]
MRITTVFLLSVSLLSPSVAAQEYEACGITPETTPSGMSSRDRATNQQYRWSCWLDLDEACLVRGIACRGQGRRISYWVEYNEYRAHPIPVYKVVFRTHEYRREILTGDACLRHVREAEEACVGQVRKIARETHKKIRERCSGAAFATLETPYEEGILREICFQLREDVLRDAQDRLAIIRRFWARQRRQLPR